MRDGQTIAQLRGKHVSDSSHHGRLARLTRATARTIRLSSLRTCLWLVTLYGLRRTPNIARLTSLTHSTKVVLRSGEGKARYHTVGPHTSLVRSRPNHRG